MVVVSFEVESMALARSAIKQGSEGSVMIINIRDRVTVVTLDPKRSSQIHIGFCDGRQSDNRSFAEKLFSFIQGRGENKMINYTPRIKKAWPYSSLANIVSAIKDEISKFYILARQNDSGGESGGKISKIILCGKDAAIAGLKEYLSQSLKIEVETAEVWVNAFSLNDRLPEISFLDSLNSP